MKKIKTANYIKLSNKDYIYIVENRDGSANVYNYRKNTDQTSVRFDLMDNIFLDSFPSVEEAKQAYPTAEIGTHKLQSDPMSSSPPDWFDPMDAGERWDDDY